VNHSFAIAGLARGAVAIWLLTWAVACSAVDTGRSYIGYVYPAGGRQGTSVEMVIGGDNIYGASAVLVSGKGILAEIIDAKAPESLLTEDQKKKKPKKNQTVIDERITVRLTMAADAEPGERNLCLVTKHGVSNMRVIQVGQLEEVREAEPNDKRETAMTAPRLPVVLNGQIMPGDVDGFRFTAQKGQQLVAAASVRTLIPYIADAVPGWFQAILILHDAKGREIACAEDFLFNQDPVLFCAIPADGEYYLSIRDSIYRGRADFTYRIMVGELPFITGITPLGAAQGQSPVTVRLMGHHLPATAITVPVDQNAPSIRSISVVHNGLLSNRVPFAISNLSEISTDDAPGPGKVQAVTIPVIVNGCIRTPGQQDRFGFVGCKGQEVALEVKARRLGSPLDSHLLLMNSRGDVIAENDDLKDRGEGMLTHQADSEIICKLPEDGRYTLRIADIQGKSGELYSYRLSIQNRAPDFELRATPAALALSQGGTASVILHAIRRDGFTGPIAIAFDQPCGLSLDGAVIPEGMDKIRMTISAPSKMAAGPVVPRLRGVGMVAGEAVTRPVVFAEDLMQAFIYQHLVPARDQVIMITDAPAPYQVAVQYPAAKGGLELLAGKELSIPVTVKRQPGFDGPVKIHLVDAPKGLVLERSFIGAGKGTGFMTLCAQKGYEGRPQDNLILIASMTLDPPGNPSDKGKVVDQPLANTAAKPTIAAKPTPAKDGKPEEKKVIKERVIVHLPAVPYRVIPAPLR
jgi:hypothetical protein